jgi:beta-N-acetylhexosaminidase
MDLKGNPFYLTNEQISWLKATIGEMTLEEKVGQLFLNVAFGDNEEEILAMVEGLKPCGVMFRTAPMDVVAEMHQLLQDHAKIPMFLAANLEAGGNGLIAEGTNFGNNMTVAATNDEETAYKLGVVCATEARALGGNLAFAPVVDININCNNPIANTRSFGDETEKVLKMGMAYMKGVQENGCGVTIKHFPGDGVDDRDHHVVASINSLSVEEWDNSFGKVYAELIKAGARGLMVGHILLPEYSRLLKPGIKDEDILPASLAPEILNGLLREKLNYNGLIISDATLMAGFSAKGKREDIVPESVAAGCDVFLFTRDWREDLGYMLAGVEKGIITETRLDEAMTRILAFKASLGLPEQKENGTLVPKNFEVVGSQTHTQWALECVDKSVTLAKDTQGLMPLSKDKYKRILVYPYGDGAAYPNLEAGQASYEKFIGLLEKEGFEVTVWDFAKNPMLNFSVMTASVEKLKDDYDLVLYFVDIPVASNKTTLRITYNSFIGFDAPWQINDIPTMMVSVANPYHLYDAPQIKTLVNAYNSTDNQLQAIVDKMLGRSEFKGVSPVDQFAGRWDAKL